LIINLGRGNFVHHFRSTNDWKGFDAGKFSTSEIIPHNFQGIFKERENDCG